MTAPAAGASAPRPARSAAAASERRWRPPVPKRPWQSVRVRITVVATLVFALAFAGAAFLLVRQVQSSLEEGVRQEAGTTVQAIRVRLESGMDPMEAMAAAAGMGVPAAIVDESGRVVAGSPAVGGSAQRTGSDAGGAMGPTMVTKTIDGDTFITSTDIATDLGDYTAVVETPLATVQRSVETITGILVVGTPLLVAAFAVMVWVLVGRSLRPVDVLRAEVDEISHTTMHRRVHEPGTDDEIDRLAVTMNEMLDRLEAASDRQRRFVSDASHELKTPLATIRTSMEVALRNPGATDWTATAQRVLDADRAMADLVADLLDLARLEEPTGSAVGPGSPVVDLDEAVMAVLGELSSTGTGTGTGTTVDASGVLAGRVRGDRGELERLVRNLVENADRHGGERIAVSLTSTDERVTLTVDDDGPGIAPEDRARVFDRFAVLDPSRTSATGGTGLGLAIVRAIAERHGGSVAITESPLGGAQVVVTLPAAG